MSDPLAFLERRRADQERRARHRLTPDMRIEYVTTPDGTARLHERGADWWEVWLHERFLGLVVRWHTHPSAVWEPLLPVGASKAGIRLPRPRFDSLEAAVTAVCALYARRWREWPATGGGFEA